MGRHIPYSTADDAYIRQHADEGAAAIAKALGRTEQAIEHRMRCVLFLGIRAGLTREQELFIIHHWGTMTIGELAIGARCCPSQVERVLRMRGLSTDAGKGVARRRRSNKEGGQQ